MGSLIYVFVTPMIYGLGYVVTTAGLAVVGVALLATLWWGVTGAIEHAPHAPHIPIPSEPTAVEPEREPVTV